MFLTILRISASNVLKTFLNIIVTIGCTCVVFHSHKPTGSINTLCQLAVTMATRKHHKYNIHVQHYRRCYTGEH